MTRFNLYLSHHEFHKVKLMIVWIMSKLNAIQKIENALSRKRNDTITDKHYF